MPAFVSRAFRHNSIYVRTDRIKTPADLKGKRIGAARISAHRLRLGARIILEDDHGIKPSDVTWVRGGIDDPSRPEKITIKLPPDVHLENAPEGETISELLESGEIDALHRAAGAAPRRQAAIRTSAGCFPIRSPPAKDYYKRTGIFPIMHVTGIRRTLVEQHPWLPAAVFKAFEQSKAKCLEALEDTSTTKVTLPFVEEQLKAARELMGSDFWSYGVAPNRKVLETFLRHHHSQGLSPRLVTPEEMFHPSSTRRSSCEILVIPGRCKAPNPESRRRHHPHYRLDSGFA